MALEGPYGLFSTAARSRKHVVMIGAGIGITPFRALLESTPFAPGNATVLLRGHSEPELYLRRGNPRALPAAAAPRCSTSPAPAPAGGSMTWLPETPSAPATGWRATSRRLPTPTSTSAARPRWAGNVLDDARAAGVREDQLHYERFDW